MNDKELVEKYLNRNYVVIADNSYFTVEDIHTGKIEKVNTLKKTLIKIFGDFRGEFGSCLDIFNAWFNLKSDLLVKDLHDYINSQDFSIGSVNLLNLCLKKFSKKNKNGNNYRSSFIEYYVETKYKEKVLIPKLINYLKEVKGNDGSRYIISIFHEKLKYETFNLQKYCVDYLNDWYADSILSSKIKTFLRELVITLGPRNWVITWIGHGPLTRKTLLDQFKDETEDHYPFILKMFDEWYEREVMDTSERMLNRNNFGNNFPSLNLERNF